MFLGLAARGLDTDSSERTLQKFVGPDEEKKVKRFYTDNSGEVRKAASLLGLRHSSVADVKQTNGIAKRFDRQVKVGISRLLLSSGLE